MTAGVLELHSVPCCAQAQTMQQQYLQLTATPCRPGALTQHRGCPAAVLLPEEGRIQGLPAMRRCKRPQLLPCRCCKGERAGRLRLAASQTRPQLQQQVDHCQATVLFGQGANRT
jgi:hypothetical protein